mmetsp:Transcript_37926/g.112277  ORF Transcript_37926/g.112277 Transcript_37926/m.112277 type:complete len:215 (-) Transcript_37926:32-676(-)
MQRLVLALRVLVCDHLPAAHLARRGLEAVAAESLRLQQLADAPVAVLCDRQQQVLHTHERVTPRCLDAVRAGKCGLEVAAEDLLICCIARDARLSTHERVGRRQQRCRVGARFRDHAARKTVGLLHQRFEQVLRLHDLLTRRACSLGSCDNSLPSLLSELVRREPPRRPAGSIRSGTCACCDSAPARKRQTRPRAERRSRAARNRAARDCGGVH